MPDRITCSNCNNHARLCGMTQATTRPTRSGLRTVAVGMLLAVVAVLLAVVVVAPIALSSGDLIRWAASPAGLGLSGGWPWLVFLALDAAAGVCVLLAVYCAFTGQSAGVFKVLVWVFAGASAFANYRHNIAPGSPADGWWFFPAASLLGPGLLEAVTWFVRRQVERGRGVRSGDRPKFGIGRWLPIIGAPRDTYGAYRTAQILGIPTVAEAVATYHALCPDGTVRVVRAIRDRDVQTARAAADEAARAAKAAARAQTNGTTEQPTTLRSVAANGRPSPTTIRASLATGHPTGTTVHSALAVSDAATIRGRWPDGLPDRGAQRLVRAELGWHPGKATNAIRAYVDRADLTTGHASAGSGGSAEGSGSANGSHGP